jgi:8-oxo-dGTP pyrophosphatase MutT (NUDIX family)
MFNSFIDIYNMQWSQIHSVISAVQKDDKKIFLKAMNEAAPFRKPPSIDEAKSSKKAGVLILLYPKNDTIYTALIQRPEYDGHHSKQISFPGGKYEKEDKNLIHTALRETEEEIGIPASSIEIITSLSSIYIPPSNFLVAPSVGWINITPEFILEEKEVDEIIEIPINEIIHHEDLKKHRFTVGNNTSIQAPAFNIQGKLIWGATCLILNEFRHRILDKI